MGKVESVLKDVLQGKIAFLGGCSKVRTGTPTFKLPRKGKIDEIESKFNLGPVDIEQQFASPLGCN